MEAARRSLAAALREVGIDSADLDARILVCAARDIDHGTLVREPDLPLGHGAAALNVYAGRRLRREPVSRILGRREFWGLPLALDPSVLDPRPETEGLVGSVLDAVGGRRGSALKILDLGIGSGAILCALLSELPGAEGVGIDKSPLACRATRRNLVASGFASRAFIACGSWGDCLDERFDVIVSNPPYIRRHDLVALPPEVGGFDPPDALDGGPDGLDAYRAIVPSLGKLLSQGGVAAFECGFDQGDAVAKLLKDAKLHAVTTYRDFAGHDRVVLGHG